jgi:hypothetical protein
MPDGTVDIIPASEAFEKLKNGDFVGPSLKCFCDFTLNSVKPGYYEEAQGVDQQYLEPVWIFNGVTSDGGVWTYYVYARSELQENDYLKRRVCTGE